MLENGHNKNTSSVEANAKNISANFQLYPRQKNQTWVPLKAMKTFIRKKMGCTT